MDSWSIDFRLGFAAGFAIAMAVSVFIASSAVLFRWIIFNRKERKGMTKPPCYNSKTKEHCKERTAIPNCHMTCKRYLKWEKIHEAECKEERKELEANQKITGYTLHNVNKFVKKRRARSRSRKG